MIAGARAPAIAIQVNVWEKMMNTQPAADASANPIDLSATPALSPFKMRIQLVDRGSNRVPLGQTDNLWMLVRVYAVGGGENAMHAHHNQDHSFIVLQGQARFSGGRGEQWILNRNEGIMIPAGGYYCFGNSGEEPLVVLRIAAKAGDGSPDVRLGVHGAQIESHSAENNRPLNAIFREGEFFE